MNIMLDVVCSTREYIRVNGEDYPQKVVKSQFLKLNDSHIDYVLTAFDRNTSNVRNIRSYLIKRYDIIIKDDLLGEAISTLSEKSVI